jgi:hypothetical protein
VFFSISEKDGRLAEINNKKEINESWQEFKKMNFTMMSSSYSL